MNKQTSIHAKLIAIILAVMTLFAAMSISASAAYSTGNYIVNDSTGANVRSGAGTSYSIKGTAKYGTTFSVSKISGSWGYTSSISCTNGKKAGWISLNICKKAASSSYSIGKYTVNYSTGANVRSGAGTNYSIKGTAKNGTAFIVSKVNGSWGYSPSITCTNGKKAGWVSLNICKKAVSSATYTGYVNTNSSPLVLRASPSTSAKALANMPKGSSLTVMDNKAKTNGFYHVKYNGTTGYASATYITFTKPNTNDNNNSSGSTYSISNNVITVKGVQLWEYPIGSTVSSSSYYFNVNGKSTYVGAKQCYGYACYVQHKLYGCCWHTAKTHFTNVNGYENIKPNASQLKTLINNAGVGAHIRVNTKNYQHSMIVIGISANGFTVADANALGTYKVDSRTYTWSSFLNNYSYGIKWIEKYV